MTLIEGQEPADPADVRSSRTSRGENQDACAMVRCELDVPPGKFRHLTLKEVTRLKSAVKTSCAAVRAVAAASRPRREGRMTSDSRRMPALRARTLLFLALRAVMTAASRDNHTLDRRLADQARFVLPAVNPVLQLKKPFFAIGVNVVRNRRSAQRKSPLAEPPGQPGTGVADLRGLAMMRVGAAEFPREKATHRRRCFPLRSRAFDSGGRS